MNPGSSSSSGVPIPEDGIPPNQASSNGNQSDDGKQNLSSVSIGVLHEIARRCCSRLEFKTIVSPGRELQFTVEAIFNGDKIGIGVGKSRKDAQQQAAENGLHNLAAKYVAYMEPRRVAFASEFHRLSLGQEDNGFLWDDDEASQESGEVQEDGLPKGSVSEASDAETGLNAPNAVNPQMEKRTISPRLPQTAPNKRLKE